MAEIEAILGESRESVERIGAADLVLGIPTYQNRETVGRVAQAGLEGLARRLPGVRAVLVNADGGSKDGTPEHLRQVVGAGLPLVQVHYPVYPVHKLSAPLPGVPGKREALSAIFAVARRLGAKACAVLDPALESAAPEWVESLAVPVLDHGADLVTPCYLRTRFEGLITSAIVYPFTRALYGKRVRQPMATDLGFSAALMDYYLGQGSAATTNGASSAATDPWSSVSAICGGFQVWQTSLGPRMVAQRDGAPDVSDTLAAVLAQVFEQMDRSAGFWQKVRASTEPSSLGPALPAAPADEPPAPAAVSHMIESFRLGCRNLHEIWNVLLPPATLLELRKMSARPEGEFQFKDDVWARTVYDFALGYHTRAIGRDHLLRALTPLYLGWVASFVGGMRIAAASEVEDHLERLSGEFEQQKRYLISRWRSPDRFNP